jgi:hypothetical protein
MPFRVHKEKQHKATERQKYLNARHDTFQELEDGSHFCVGRNPGPGAHCWLRPLLFELQNPSCCTSGSSSFMCSPTIAPAVNSPEATAPATPAAPMAPTSSLHAGLPAATTIAGPPTADIPKEGPPVAAPVVEPPTVAPKAGPPVAAPMVGSSGAAP